MLASGWAARFATWRILCPAALDSPDETSANAGARYRQALLESISQWDAPSEARRSDLISQCIRLGKARINVVAERHWSGAYASAATLARAAAAVLSSNDSTHSGKKLLEELMSVTEAILNSPLFLPRLTDPSRDTRV